MQNAAGQAGEDAGNNVWLVVGGRRHDDLRVRAWPGWLSKAGLGVRVCGDVGAAVADVQTAPPEVIVLAVDRPEADAPTLAELRRMAVAAQVPLVEIPPEDDPADIPFSGVADRALLSAPEPVMLVATVTAAVRVRRAERERQRLQDELERATLALQDVADARRRWLTAAHHDLGGPVSALRLRLQLLTRVARRDPSQLASPTGRARLAAAEEQAERLAHALLALLEGARTS